MVLVFSLPGALAKQGGVIRRGGMHRSGRTAPEVVGDFVDAVDHRVQHPTPGEQRDSRGEHQ